MKYCLYILIIVCLLFGKNQAQNIPRENVSAPNGLQVNTYTGNLFYQRGDLFIPAVGLPMDISFYYNSALRNDDQGYGYGWTFSYGMRYFFINGDQDSAVVEWPDGRRDVHVNLAGQGEYQAISKGLFYGFVQVQNGGPFELRTKEGMSYYFEDALHRKITRIEDPNGNTLLFTYNGHQLTTITDASGRSLSLTWSGSHLTKITDALETPSREIVFSYDADSQLVSVQNPAGFLTYTYGPDHELTSVSDENGNPVVIHYRSNAEAVSKIVSCAGDQVFQYHGAEGKTYVIENGNNTTTFSYDSEGTLLRKYGNCCGFDLSYTYDDDYNITQVTDGRGNSMNMTYDSSGNLTWMRDAELKEMNMSYEPNFNRLTSLQDRREATTLFNYDNHGNLTSIQRPQDISENFTYDTQGNLTGYTDGKQLNTTFSYNNAGDLTQINYPLSQESFTYDGRGNLLTATDGNGHMVQFAYDDYDQLISITDPESHTFGFGYDPNGNLIWELDGNGDSVYYEYDPLDRLGHVITAAGTTYYHYDALSNLTGITNANGNTTAFAYNDLNLVATETDPMGFSISYEYDANGNLVSKLDANGVTTTYTYDKLNRLTSRNYPEGNDHYEYDANGNLTRSYNDHIDYTFTYDSLNRLLSKTVQPWNKTISYTYDAAGNRESMTDPDGGITQYVYDDNHRLTSLTNPFSQTTGFVYDDAGRMTRQNNANGTYAVYQYDDADNLEELTHYKSNGDTLAFFVYTYDDIGYRTSMRDLQGLHTYQYDAAGRLTHVTYANGDTEDYTYDGAGNRTMLVKNGTDTTLYGYDAADRILFAGGTAFRFDGNGNMVEKVEGGDTTRYFFNSLNKLSRINLPEDTFIEFEYDPTGLRIMEQRSSSVIINFFLDGPNLIQELDSNIQLIRRYTTGLAIDKLISFSENNLTFYYHQNDLSSIMNISGQNENTINQYYYSSFGSVISMIEGVNNNFFHTGIYLNKESNLYYHRNRYYIPGLGIFLNKDIFLGYYDYPQSQNRFSYVNHNPTNHIDPNGDVAVIPVIIAGAGWGALESIIIQFLSHGCINWKNVAKDAAIGAIPLGIGINTLRKLRKVRKIALDQRRLVEAVNRSFGRKIQKVYRKPINSRPIIKYPWTRMEELNETLFRYENKWNFVGLGGLAGVLFGINTALSTECNPDKGEEKGNQNGSQPDGAGSPDGSTDQRRPFDPNEIVAPAGYDSLHHWVSVKATLPYTILFENDPDSGATVAAQQAQINMDIDPHLDPFSFRLGDFGFGNYYFSIAEDLTHYQTRLDVSDTLGVWVDVDFGIEIDSGFAYWRFVTIDTATGEPTQSLIDGFLPVNDSITRRGEGFVNFTITPKANSQTGDKIEPQAAIFFDFNNPVLTPYVFNTIDADPPMVVVNQDRWQIDSSRFQIGWTGTDMGAGVAHYDIFVSMEDQPFVLWLDNTTATAAVFPGQFGNDYCFIARAADHTGNVGKLSDSCDYAFTFEGPVSTQEEDLANAGSGFLLMQNQPNPFPQKTLIPFKLDRAGLTELFIFTSEGKLIKRLLGEYLLPGSHQVIWDGTDQNDRPVSSGVYIYQLRLNGHAGARRMLLLR